MVKSPRKACAAHSDLKKTKGVVRVGLGEVVFNSTVHIQDMQVSCKHGQTKMKVCCASLSSLYLLKSINC